MQKQLLVLNGSHSDIPLIQAGKRLGYHVITTGNDPSLIGHQYADEYINADFSNYKLITEIASDKKIDAVCACANDFGAITASYVAEQLHLPGHDSFETTLILHHKDKFKKFARDINLLTPPAEGFQDVSVALEYAASAKGRIIVKPIDLTGGKGISKALTMQEKENAVKTAFDRSPSKRIVIEPFIEGTYHSFNTFIVNKKVVMSYSDNEYSFASPYYISTSAGPADRIDETRPVLIRELEKVAEALQLKDGKLHAQYVMDSSGTPYIIELTRRTCGDMYCVPVEKALGIKINEWIVKAECGYDVSDIPHNFPHMILCGRHNIVTPRAGSIRSFSVSPELMRHVYDSFIWWKPGYTITDPLHDKIGILFYSFDSREEMISIVEHITDHISFEYY